MATMPAHTFRHLTNAPPWLQGLHKLKKLQSLASVSPPPSIEDSGKSQKIRIINDDNSKDVIESKAGKPNSRSFFPKRGQTLELVCDSLGFKGKGICKVEDTGFVVMCDRALPGERFFGRVTRRKGSYAEVTKVKTISPHRDLVEAPCKYASYCGGCKTQNLSYEAQCKAKEQQFHELIVHAGKFSDKDPEFLSVMKPIVPCDIQFHYRNKMEFSFGSQKWLPIELLGQKLDGIENYALGLHAPGFFDKVLDVDKCLLQSEPANMVLATVQDCWRDPQFSLTPYDVHSHDGYLKHLMLRTGSNPETGMLELMVNFVTSSYRPELLKPLVEKISAIQEVVSIVNNINSSVGPTSVGEQEYTLYGKPTITEKLWGLTFQISANSFFQTNTHQAEVLYKLIEDSTALKGDGSEIVLDLFCGTGTIGLTLAKRVKHVYGYEVVPQAISDACRNAELNGITNATFLQGDLNKIHENFGNDFPTPDLVITENLKLEEVVQAVMDVREHYEFREVREYELEECEQLGDYCKYEKYAKKHNDSKGFDIKTVLKGDVCNRSWMLTPLNVSNNAKDTPIFKHCKGAVKTVLDLLKNLKEEDLQFVRVTKANYRASYMFFVTFKARNRLSRKLNTYQSVIFYEVHDDVHNVNDLTELYMFRRITSKKGAQRRTGG